MNPRIVSSIVIGLLLLAGCSTTTQEAEDAPAAAAGVITREQIAATNQRNAYDAIRQLQPMWVQKRRQYMRDVDPVWVYVDGVRLGDVDELRLMDAESVIEVRHLNATDAMTRFGTGHSSGAILVTTMP